MSTPYIDRAYLQINGITLDCNSVKPSSNNGTKAVPTMNRENRAKGFSRGVQEYAISAEVPLSPDVEDDIDFFQMLEDGEEFTCVIEYEGGSTHAYTDSRFSKVDVDSKHGDVTNYSVDIIPLDRATV